MKTQKPSLLRQATAKYLTKSQSIPFTPIWTSADVSKLLEIRAVSRHKFSAMLLYLLAESLLRMPEMNIGWEEKESQIILYDTLNLGISLNTKDDDVVVARIAESNRKNISQLNSAISELEEKAKTTGKILEKDIFPLPNIVLNNAGMMDIEGGVPIPLPWNALMVTTFTVKRMPVADPHKPWAIGVLPMMNVVLTFDHRLFDGAKAAKFLALFKQRLENPRF
ncbi:hypothetical protein A3G55_04080 [Candidatus Giovannonibacteria bacterium RIFCSPLOWO2_12_FULL_44_25]|uniref:Dihydrolipoamide succinyltransferase n=4 Tax=Parcubacteria group TaxID=1794811 RepID=A0A837IGW5_9BACT|nr:MAG: 2-oxoglutarate dehydrogenase, E2 component, dihydrolipoamide succinyltransferase [Parcubacteria group bacterium GW2011_GWC1_44_10]KKT56994.1 MAG: dihydrolipoamide succinyltransferase [Candidatus Giovannonibacteria bacterium GW2011_GWB1_44_23]KKT59605.1 MAG: dihydrolipoamide succinyltransferase [Candidatus Giovannonibacteria bacterium GW2011_GWA1_44_25]KKU12511.1 MAG: dihydrolipoamide succinyltransferase [Candidatus Azambacteria bacterium GW2011_GWC2_45_7b]OGF49851.1 MAG: hypothetical pr